MSEGYVWVVGFVCEVGPSLLASWWGSHEEGGPVIGEVHPPWTLVLLCTTQLFSLCYLNCAYFMEKCVLFGVGRVNIKNEQEWKGKVKLVSGVGGVWVVGLRV